jgi:hypothetical protein
MRRPSWPTFANNDDIIVVIVQLLIATIAIPRGRVGVVRLVG